MTPEEVNQVFLRAASLIYLAGEVEASVCPRVFIEALDGYAWTLNGAAQSLSDSEKRITYRYMVKAHQKHRA